MANQQHGTVRQQRTTRRAAIVEPLDEAARIAKIVEQARLGIVDVGLAARQVLDAAIALSGMDAADIYWFDAATGLLHVLATTDTDRQLLHPALRPGWGLNGIVFVEAQPLFVANYAGWASSIIWARQRGIQSTCAAPIEVGGHTVGVLNAYAYRRVELSPQRLEQLANLALLLAPVTPLLHIYASSQRNQATTTILSEVMRRSAMTEDVSSLLAIIPEYAALLLGADYAGVRYWDETTEPAWHGIWGARTTQWGHTPQPANKLFTASERTPGQTLIVREIGAGTAFPAEEFPVFVAEGGRVTALTPLAIGERTWGELVLGWRSEVAFTASQIELIEALASTAATAIDAVQSRKLASAKVTAILESITNAFYALDREWRFTYVNKSAEQYLLRTHEELIGRSYWQALPEMVGTDVGALFHRAVAEQAPVRIEDWYDPLVDLWFDGHAYPSPDGLAVYFHDITPRKRAQDALRRSEEQYRRIVETANEGILALDADGRMTYLNRCMAAMLGYTVEEMLGQLLFSFMDEELAAATRLAVEQRRHNMAETRQFDTRFRHRDGHAIWVMASTVALTDDAGQFAGEFGMLTDITERKIAEDALRVSERRLAIGYRAIAVLANAHTMDEGVAALLAAVTQELGWDVGLFWSARGDKLVCTGVWTRTSDAATEMLLRNQTIQHGGDLPGRCWAEEIPIHSEDVSHDPTFLRRLIAKRLDLHGSICLPVAGRDGIIGVLEYFSQQAQPSNPAVDEALAAVAQQCGQFVERVRAEESLEQSEHRLRTVITNAPLALFQIDGTGIVTLSEGRTLESIGLMPGQLVGASVYDAFANRSDIVETVDHALAGERAVSESTLNGRALETYWAPYMTGSTAAHGVIGVAVDVTERKRAEEALKETDEREAYLSQYAHGLNTIVAIDGTIAYASPSYTRILGHIPHQLIGGSLFAYMPDEDAHAVQRELTRLTAIDGAVGRIEFRMRHHDESLHTLEATIYNRLFTPAIGGFVLNAHDVTERIRLTNELLRQAQHDTLTALPNRALAAFHLDEMLRDAASSGDEVAVLLLDINRLGEINSTLGYDAGDAVLREVAVRVRRISRQNDVVARGDGDKFLVLLPQADRHVVQTTLRLIVAALAERPMEIQGLGFQLGCSIGVALYPEHGREARILLRNADVALHTAKSQLGAIVVYDPTCDIHTTERLALIEELRQAIAQNSLLLHYQPKVDLATGGVLSVEALVRWPHRTRGLLSPGAFVSLAEQSGLIRDMAQCVLKAAIADCQAWQRRGVTLPVAVNLSMWNLYDPKLPDDIRNLLSLHAIAPELLHLEITESTAMKDPEYTIDMLQQLKEMGISLAIDDFGKEYSSLSYLKRLPADELKIDQSFIRGMVGNATDTNIVTLIIGLGQTLNMRVVAEGVEDRPTYDLLRTLTCHGVQGYHIARPMPAADLLRWLGDRNKGELRVHSHR